MCGYKVSFPLPCKHTKQHKRKLIVLFAFKSSGFSSGQSQISCAVSLKRRMEIKKLSFQSHCCELRVFEMSHKKRAGSYPIYLEVASKRISLFQIQMALLGKMSDCSRERKKNLIHIQVMKTCHETLRHQPCCGVPNTVR